jgi:hypothetical protein
MVPLHGAPSPTPPTPAAEPRCPLLLAARREEVCGRNCRFLQGPGTDADEVARLRVALTADPPQPVTVSLQNYRWGAWHCQRGVPLPRWSDGAG